VSICYHATRSLVGVVLGTVIIGCIWGLINLLSFIFRIEIGASCLILMMLMVGWLIGSMVLGYELDSR
jgi:hypothetical protein